MTTLSSPSSRDDVNSGPYPIRPYLKDIRRFDLLTADEEAACAAEIAAGSMVAKHKLTQSNLRLVVNIAKRYVGRGVSFDELIQEGNTGLMKAVDRYRPRNRFTTYAKHWVKKAVLEALMTKQERRITVPIRAHDVHRSWRKAAQTQFAKNNVLPTRAQVVPLVNFYGMKNETFECAQKILHGHEVNPASDRIEFGRGFEVSPDRMVAASELQDRAVTLMNTLLCEKERRVLRSRLGFDGDSQTLRQVGVEVGVSRNTARKIESGALTRLREALDPEVPFSQRKASIESASAPLRDSE